MQAKDRTAQLTLPSASCVRVRLRALSELHAQCQERYPDDQPVRRGETKGGKLTARRDAGAMLDLTLCSRVLSLLLSQLSLQDTQEGELRFHLWNVYTLTPANAAGPLHETAVVALDSLHLLVTLSCISNSAASESFEAAVRLKAAACLSALREGGPKLFAECLDQFFPSAEAPEVEGGNPRCCSAATADSVDKRKAQGAKLFSDAELRGYRLFTTRRQLLMYAEAKSQLATLRAKAPLAAVLRKQLEDVDSEYSRENVQEKCYNTIRLIMSALKCNGPAVLETIAKAIENRDWKALTVRSSDKDKPEEDEEEEDAADDFADAADAMEDEVNGYDASPVVADPFVAAADEEVQEEEEQEEEEPEPAPVPVKRRPGRPTKAEVAARAAAAAAPATPKIRAPLSLTPAPVPEVARTLQAASDKLKSATKSARNHAHISERQIVHVACFILTVTLHFVFVCPCLGLVVILWRRR